MVVTLTSFRNPDKKILDKIFSAIIRKRLGNFVSILKEKKKKKFFFHKDCIIDSNR